MHRSPLFSVSRILFINSIVLPVRYLVTFRTCLIDQTCRDLDLAQRCRLAAVLLKYSDIFPVPGSPLTGHTDAVEHDINTGDRPPIRCAPRRMSPQKMNKEEECVVEMLTGGQIEPSDSPWSSPVVLVTKKEVGTRFCADYRRLNDVTTKDALPTPYLGLTIPSICWPVGSGSLPSTWPVAIGRCHCPRRPGSKLRSQRILAYFSLASVMPQRPLSAWWTGCSMVSGGPAAWFTSTI